MAAEITGGVRTLVVSPRTHFYLMRTGIPGKEDWPVTFPCRIGGKTVYRWIQSGKFVRRVLGMMADITDGLIQGWIDDPYKHWKVIAHEVHSQRIPSDYMPMVPARPKLKTEVADDGGKTSNSDRQDGECVQPTEPQRPRRRLAPVG